MPNSNATEPTFLTVQVHVRGDLACNVNVVLSESDTEVAAPSIGPDGTLNVSLPIPQGDIHHTQLGIFMDRWSRLERVLQDLLGGLTGLEFGKTQVLVNALGSKSLVDVILPLALPKLSPEDHVRLTKLLDRFKKLNTKRNYLVHGHWMVDAMIHAKNGQLNIRSEAVRGYPPADPRDEKGIRDWKNQKLRVKYLFTVTRIKGTTRDTVTLTKDLTDFMLERSAKDPVNPMTAEEAGWIPM